MSATTIGLALAMGAAVALNGSYLMQHAGSAGAIAVDARRPLATLASLLRSPLWTVGAVVGFSGWALHIGAMREAPLSLVQAFVAGGLALTAPMAALGLRRRPGRDEARALAAMVVALVLLALGLRGARPHEHFDGLALAGWIAGLAALAAALAAGGRRGREAGAVEGAGRGREPGAVEGAGRGREAGAVEGRARGREATAGRRPEALGLAGGLLYGAADLALKAATGLHAAALVVSPWPWVALAATVGAFFSFQRALQGGRPVAVIALMTAATNVGSILGAFVVLGEPLGRTPLLASLHALAFVLVVAAAWRLAPAQARLTAA